MGEPLVDVYNFEDGESRERLKQLAELTRTFSAQMSAQGATAAELAGKMNALGEQAARTDEALQEQATALKSVERETKKAAEAQKGLSDFFKQDLQQSLLSTQAQYELLKRSIGAVIEFVKEGVHEYLEAEQASTRLAFALKNAGAAGTFVARNMDETADSMERSTGQSAEFIKALQQTALQLGVMPAQVERFTKAAMDMAALTGGDARSSMMLLTRAHAEGKDELKKWGISVDEATFAAKGFDAVLDEVEKKVGGTAVAMSSQMQTIHNLAGAWGDLKKAVGEVVVEMGGEKEAAKWRNVASQIDWLSEQLTGKHAKALKETKEQYAENAAIVEKLITAEKALAFNEKALDDYRAAHPNGPYIADLEREVAASRAAARAIDDKRLALLGLKRAEDGPKDFDFGPNGLNDELAKREEERQKRLVEIAEAKKRWAEKHAREMEEIAKKNQASMRREFEMMKEEDYRLDAEAKKLSDNLMIASDDLWRSINEGEKASMDSLVATLEVAGGEVDKFLHEQTEHVKEVYAQMRQELEGFGAELLQGEAHRLAQGLLAREEYDNEIRSATVDRMAEAEAEAALRDRLGEKAFNDLEEETKLKMISAEADGFRGDMSMKLAQEEAAAEDLRRAQLLASIAERAGVEALFELAKAAASFEAPPVAAAHLAAAAAFGAVALAAGGAAAAITAGRANTTEERTRLEDLKARDRERSARESRQSADSDSGKTGGPSVVVYQLGISGFTELEQARQLDKVQREYAQLQTGGG